MITLSVPKRLMLPPGCLLYSQRVFTMITDVATGEIIFSWTFRTRRLTYLPQMSHYEWSHHPTRHTITKQKLTLLHSQQLLLQRLCKKASQSMSFRSTAVTVLTCALQLPFLSIFCNYYRHCMYFILKLRWEIAVYIMAAHGCYMNSSVVCLSVLVDNHCDSTSCFLLSSAMKRLINLHTI